MKTNEFIKEDYEEYNDEAGMVKSNLHTIIHSAEELEQLKVVRDENDKFVIELGRIGYQKAILEAQEESIKKDIIALQQRELVFSDELVKKYGNINVDLETGTIS